MRFPVDGHRFVAFFPPYRRLEVLDHPYQIPRSPFPNRGSVLVWNLRTGGLSAGSRAVQARPPGVALFVLLPPGPEMEGEEVLLRLMASCRPHSILPHLSEVDPEELVAVLRRFPSEFSIEVTEYLAWRGVEVDLDTRRLIRKTLDLSGELRTVSGLARALYMSRRALGRRFMTRGLPVPSHWLHFGRILRGAIKLQDPAINLFSVGCELGYPDGFAFSNQMHRLTGLRPSIMKECFGWEWIVESWLTREAECGHLSRQLKAILYPERDSALAVSSAVESVPGSRAPALRVAERAKNAR